jgi:hypothetical protein
VPGRGARGGQQTHTQGRGTDQAYLQGEERVGDQKQEGRKGGGVTGGAEGAGCGLRVTGGAEGAIRSRRGVTGVH